MMVEAGATPGAFKKIAAGAPKITEEVLIEGLEESKKWISAAIEIQRDLKKAVEAENGPIADIVYVPNVDYTPAIMEAVKLAVGAEVEKAMVIADKHDRTLRLEEIKAELVEKLCGTEEAPKELL